ncbi:protein kintoun [Rattus norvegicus]|uniref:Protein kintoun n=1 Tax=Rattus norvegicus TaxID=10116 RepID=KTU_RAT|nr:protein kintoun [Rattus norvegicus]Q5FVL7.2 RecName: Full=Protein kintoun; AltName: Full=Dynein assembly factor 2, axonemal [Rattus norvegicus]|eukprot:NP_001014219.3 protein kintoun [Rattus norvegicus]
MAKTAASSALEDLDLSGEEVQRLTSAFQDPEFRRMFSDYAAEITDPENRRRYEEEITALERERGVEVRFVHPEPGHVLRTSLDGEHRCFVNVCSNSLVGAPSSRPGPGRGGTAAGSHWSLPYSLAPGRQYAGRNGNRYTVYDVVFHPEALALARSHERFREMLDATALEAVEQQFGVRLDRRNAKTLKIKYKGTPEAAVLRTPLPEGVRAQPEGELPGLLPYPPYPYHYPAAAESTARSPASPAPKAVQRPEPTEPRCSVVQRHHVDLQDYRCSRDAAPSTVPHELVVTIELPLLRSAERAELEVKGKLLCLDSRNPDYRLRLSLPYPVDDGRGRAQYNKARRQLVVTLPVALAVARQDFSTTPEGPTAETGTDNIACTSAGDLAGAREESADSSGADHGRKSCVVAPDAGTAKAEGELVPEPEQDFGGDSVTPLGPGEGTTPENRSLLYSAFQSGDAESLAERSGVYGDLSVQTSEEQEGTCHDTSGSDMGGPGTESIKPLCPPLQCNQDEDSLTLLIQVPGIQPQSLHGDLSPFSYELCFSTQDSGYSFTLQFAPENKLSTKEPAISISLNNAVIVLAKSPESHGLWREWYWGLNKDSLEERLFIDEENVNEFLEEVVRSPLKPARSLSPPLIEVLQVTEEQIQIHAKLQECSDPDGLQGKEKGVKEECPLSEKENTEHSTTSTADSNSSVAVEGLKINTCGAVGLQQGCPDVPHVLSGKRLQSEAKMDPEFIRESSTAYSAEEKENIKEPVITKEKKIGGDHLSSLPNKTAVQNTHDFDTIKETNMQDGSVQIIKDHTTHCAFDFQNSLLYDLD